METQLRNDEYKIGAVSKITGIGTETLRAWERRYKAVVPSRSESGDRVYSSEDLSKLFLLKNLTQAGNSIGTIARLPLEELKSKWENSVQLSEMSSSANNLIIIKSYQKAKTVKYYCWERISLLGSLMACRTLMVLNY